MTDLDRMGRDPLHYAAAENDVTTVQQRLAAGVGVDITEDREGYTPLFFAVQEGALDAARYLLEAGASVRCTTTAGAAKTPLHLAVSRWRKSPDGAMIRLLLEYGADKAATTRKGRTPRLIAQGQFDFPDDLAELLDV
ncbi:ankyrin repeat domain-containing protein [Saccharopolyspora gregorii]|uniref:ankyrin repeat domain-containing protein n=1 Tax=Saccharopolyspora gregorii TaxID=33914 RepID=UPI0021AC9F95|nr:ankyrin repeat domain-containing protein [Saccharopolyspora gregorii]